MKTYQSFSSESTKKFGELFAQKIVHTPYPIPHTRGALVLALQGDLGAGKTTFTQGFFKGLGIKRHAVSPTFVIMRRYRVPKSRGDKRQVASDKGFADVYHFDAYRLKKAEDLEVLEFDDILSNPKNIVLIEWSERVREVLPKGAVWLRFGYGKMENERVIRVGGGTAINLSNFF